MATVMDHPYLRTFLDHDAPECFAQLNEDLFLSYYKINEDKSLEIQLYTRKKILYLVLQALQILEKNGVGKGDSVCHFFSCNKVEDLVFRMASVIVGSVPVTINWGADTVERIVYKVKETKSKLLIVDKCTNVKILRQLKSNAAFLRETRILDVSFCQPIGGWSPRLDSAASKSNIRDLAATPSNKLSDTRIIIFTSGTTGNPKGVKLTYENYETNRKTFESFLGVSDECDVHLELVIVNPLHHTNSTAFTDWGLRRHKTHVHLFERYTSGYWQSLAQLGQANLISDSKYKRRIVAPVVSRHFDFLESLAERKLLPMDEDSLQECLNQIDFLIGSAPVGPRTIARLQRFTGNLPYVRFGSTETCLQVLGTPRGISSKARLGAFRKGWSHVWENEPCSGYYIGQDHDPHTDVKIVKSTSCDDDQFMVECKEGEPGYIVTSGRNLMAEYVNNIEATKHAFVVWNFGRRGKKASDAKKGKRWYLNLGDVAFKLKNTINGKDDIYWVSRDNALLIRGGANYAYAQINFDLKNFILKKYTQLTSNDFEIAVVGLKLNSEHEDECMVTIEWLNDNAKSNCETALANEFVSAACQKDSGISKGSRPSFVRFGQIPRNFKGAILVKELKADWERELENKKRRKT
eukprot:g11930.t1